MADDEPNGASAGELAALRRELSDLKAALEDERTARTASEKKEARADVADAEDDVRAAAKRAGLTVEQYNGAIAAARKARFKEEHADEIRELVNEELDKLIEAAQDDEDGDDDERDEEEKPEPKAKAKPKPQADTEPVKEHWSEGAVSGLLR